MTTLTDQQRTAIVNEAAQWIGTPYHHHARIKGVGVDCAQLLCAVFEACGLIAPVNMEHYPVDWHLHHSAELFSQRMLDYCTLQPQGAPLQPGDVCLWRYGRTYSHGSIYVGADCFVHAYIGLGVVVTRRGEEPLGQRAMQHWVFNGDRTHVG